jgi:hypothetical protein
MLTPKINIDKPASARMHLSCGAFCVFVKFVVYDFMPIPSVAWLSSLKFSQVDQRFLYTPKLSRGL